MKNTEIRIDETKSFHGRKINHFTEKWIDDTRSIQFSIVFDDGDEMIIEPYIDKNTTFESSRNDLRLKYKKIKL